jgi:RNA polymerase sigma-70 factor (ECF subfamily)
MRHRAPGPYQLQAAIAGLHARAARPRDTDWAGKVEVALQRPGQGLDEGEPGRRAGDLGGRDGAVELAGTPAEAAHIRLQLDRLAGDGSKDRERI